MTQCIFTRPSASLLYPKPSTVNEQNINEKILANNKFSNIINIEDTRNYETETKLF